MVKIVHKDPLETYEALLDLSIALNRKFYHLSQSGTMVYRADHTRREVEYAIDRVRKESTRRKKILRIAERFPADWPLDEQAAYLLRAFSGLQIFPDANHRTGLAIMREHLHHYNRHFHLDGEPLAQFISNLRSLRSPYCTRCNAGQLQFRNPSFQYIAETVSANTRRLTWLERAGRKLSLVPVIRAAAPPLITSYSGTTSPTPAQRE